MTELKKTIRVELAKAKPTTQEAKDRLFGTLVSFFAGPWIVMIALGYAHEVWPVVPALGYWQTLWIMAAWAELRGFRRVDWM